MPVEASDTTGIVPPPAHDTQTSTERDLDPRADRPKVPPVARSVPETTAISPKPPPETASTVPTDTDVEASVSETTVTPEVTPEQAPLIVNRSYGLELGELTPGAPVYVDRDFVYGTVPDAYLGLPSMKTPNDLRREASALAFTASRPVEVFVAHDRRITKKPAWLASFRMTGQVVTVNEGGKKNAVTVYDIYVTDIPTGVVKFGSNAPPRQRRKHRISMYLVFLRAK